MSAEPVGKPSERLNLPQFHLRTLFVVVGLFGALFAIMGVVGPVASAGLLLFLALVGLHVVANALGTVLRDRSTPRQPTRTVVKFAIAPPARCSLCGRARPISRLFQRTPVGWLIWLTGLGGALTGSSLAAIVLAQWAEVSVTGLLVGAVSCGVLGGFFGFMAGSFLQMTLCAWCQATSDSEAVDDFNTCPARCIEP